MLLHPSLRSLIEMTLNLLLTKLQWRDSSELTPFRQMGFLDNEKGNANAKRAFFVFSYLSENL